MRTDIGEMAMQEVREELAQWLRELEKVVPKEWDLRFGKLEQLREFTDNLLWEYDQVCEQLDEMEETEKKFSALQEEVDQVADELMDIPDIEVNYEDKVDNGSFVDQEIGKAIKKLQELSQEDWKPYKKPKGKKR